MYNVVIVLYIYIYIHIHIYTYTYIYTYIYICPNIFMSKSDNLTIKKENATYYFEKVKGNGKSFRNRQHFHVCIKEQQLILVQQSK